MLVAADPGVAASILPRNRDERGRYVLASSLAHVEQKDHPQCMDAGMSKQSHWWAVIAS
jgi:hypothetical protein